MCRVRGLHTAEIIRATVRNHHLRPYAEIHSVSVLFDSNSLEPASAEASLGHPCCVGGLGKTVVLSPGLCNDTALQGFCQVSIPNVEVYAFRAVQGVSQST